MAKKTKQPKTGHLRPYSKLKKLPNSRKGMPNTQPPIDIGTYEDLTLESKAFLKDMEAFLVKHYGKRCPDLGSGCICCQVWSMFDTLTAIVA